MISDVPVEIHYGDKYVAHAGALDVDIPGEVYILRGAPASTACPG